MYEWNLRDLIISSKLDEYKAQQSRGRMCAFLMWSWTKPLNADSEWLSSNQVYAAVVTMEQMERLNQYNLSTTKPTRRKYVQIIKNWKQYKFLIDIIIFKKNIWLFGVLIWEFNDVKWGQIRLHIPQCHQVFLSSYYNTFILSGLQKSCFYLHLPFQQDASCTFK